MEQKAKTKLGLKEILGFIVLIIFILHFIIKSFTWNWTIYVISMILALISALMCKDLYLKNTPISNIDINFTFKQSSIITFSAWIYISFIFTLVMKYKKASMILSLIIFIFSTISFVNSFINYKEKNTILNFSIIVDFLLSILVMIFFLINLPNTNNLQNIATSIVSVVYGGILTLVGVGLTIKYSQKEKKEELIFKNKPLIFIVNPIHVDYDNLNDTVLETPKYIGEDINIGEGYTLNNFYLQNSDYSYCSIYGFFINDDAIIFPISQALQKNKTYVIKDMNFKFKNKINSISLLLIDMLNNKYVYDLNFKIENNKINIESGIEIKPL